jgi:hypothetical protein
MPTYWCFFQQKNILPSQFNLNNRAAAPPPAYICDEDLSVLVEAAVELRLEDRAEEGQDQLVRVDPFSARKLKNKML